MKLKAFVLIGAFILTAACSKNEDNLIDIEGKYIGTFQRDVNVANIEIEFTSNTFSGKSVGSGYSIPIYHGEYSISNDIIIFDNKQLVLPTVYDPSTLLEGKWFFSFNQNTLVLLKSNGDKYMLEKK